VTPRSSSTLPLSGGGTEDYVTVNYVNGHCTHTSSTSDGRQCVEVTSLEHQQAILASHLQVSGIT